MPESDTPWVRVRQPETGHHITVSRALFEATPGLTALKQDATDPGGNPLPPKYHVDKESAGKNPAQAAEKENS